MSNISEKYASGNLRVQRALEKVAGLDLPATEMEAAALASTFGAGRAFPASAVETAVHPTGRVIPSAELEALALAKGVTPNAATISDHAAQLGNAIKGGLTDLGSKARMLGNDIAADAAYYLNPVTEGAAAVGRYLAPITDALTGAGKSAIGAVSGAGSELLSLIKANPDLVLGGSIAAGGLGGLVGGGLAGKKAVTALKARRAAKALLAQRAARNKMLALGGAGALGVGGAGLLAKALYDKRSGK